MYISIEIFPPKSSRYQNQRIRADSYELHRLCPSITVDDLFPDLGFRILFFRRNMFAQTYRDLVSFQLASQVFLEHAYCVILSPAHGRVKHTSTQARSWVGFSNSVMISWRLDYFTFLNCKRNLSLWAIFFLLCYMHVMLIACTSFRPRLTKQNEKLVFLNQ